MDNIKQSLLILDYFAWLVMRKAEMLYTKLMHVALVDDKVYDDDNYHMLSQSCIINTCSFMEEYHKEFGVKTETAFKEKITMIKKIAAPYTKTISKWSDLNGYRNVIAHTLRNKEGQFIYLDPDIETKYNTPNNPYEWLLLRNCMIEVKNILNIEFKQELLDARTEIELIEYNSKKEPIWTARELEERFLSIIDESKAIAKKMGKYYDPNITKFYNTNKPFVKYGMIESY